jgi:dethiobiotin synthetase
MRGLFVTGTDTGAGKTVVTCAIARQWRRQGHLFRVRKPVSTGGNEDARLLAEASGQNAEEITPFVFREPAAPPVAAACEGRQLSFYDIHRVTFTTGEALLIEGVGGLLCPLTDRETVADFASTFGLPLVVAARRSLGTLNHTLLTLEAARARGLRVAGVVVCETAQPSSVAEHTAVDELRRRGVTVLTVAPFGNPGPALDAVDWWSLAR